MKILVSTMHRTASNKESHGFLYKIDWSQKTIEKKLEAPPLWTHFNPRNRGGRRGLRGITTYKGLHWVASCEVIFGLNDDLELVRMISHPYMAHIHDIVSDKNGIWVTSTGGDGVFLIDENQNVLHETWLNEKPADDLRVRLDNPETYHINSVFHDKSSVCLYGLKTGEIFKVFPGPVERLTVIEGGCHNVFNTPSGYARSISEKSIFKVGEKQIQLPRTGEEGEFTKPGWLRGCARVSAQTVLLGSTPASVFEIDTNSMQIMDEMKLETDVNWTITGIHVL